MASDEVRQAAEQLYADIVGFIARYETPAQRRQHIVTHLEATLAATRAEAEADRERLRAALEQVEWVRGRCPWCRGYSPQEWDRQFRHYQMSGPPPSGHRDDCPRQRALGGE